MGYKLEKLEKLLPLMMNELEKGKQTDTEMESTNHIGYLTLIDWEGTLE